MRTFFYDKHSDTIEVHVEEDGRDYWVGYERDNVAPRIYGRDGIPIGVVENE